MILALSAILYKISDSPNTLNKTLGTGKTITSLKPYRDCSILSPRFILDYDSTVLGYNYIYISAFGRYYYIDDITIATAQTMVISCSVDVLMSFNTDIKNCPINVIRTNTAPTYVPDNSLPIDTSRFYTEGIEFPNTKLSDMSLLGYHYILLTR